MKFQFPKSFYWGAATAAHQVEGGNFNDWSKWEKENAERLAKEAEQKFGDFDNWQEIKLQAQDPQNYISGRACDHYHKYEEDFDIAKSLRHNAYRFSIEWSRIEPEKGKFDEAEIEHYKNVVKALKERGIEPFATLWHWPIPLWLSNEGGVKNKNFSEYFSRYAERVVKELPVKFWITLNEPEIYASMSYLKGEWPPQNKNLFSYFKVIGNLIEAHCEVYGIIKKNRPEAQIGIAKNNVYFEVYNNKFINRLIKKIINWWWNFYFLNQINDHSDFIGLNHYYHKKIGLFYFKDLFKSSNSLLNQKESKITSDMNWELYPEGIYYVLKDLKKYNKPIYITENGLADVRDKHREWFIKETLKNVHKAIEEGVDVRGYLYWSLLDNFEWDKGFWPRFGLVEMNYETMERKIRKSAYEYAKIIRANAIEIE